VQIPQKICSHYALPMWPRPMARQQYLCDVLVVYAGVDPRLLERGAHFEGVAPDGGSGLPQENFENKLLRCDFLASDNQ
jgi:hypothetical protein